MTLEGICNLGSQEHSDDDCLFCVCELKPNLDQGRQHPGRAEVELAEVELPRTLLPLNTCGLASTSFLSIPVVWSFWGLSLMLYGLLYHQIISVLP